jgi:hydrogenase maturation protease
MGGGAKIVAIGNALAGDDGAGPAALRRLRERGLPAGVDAVDSGADPLNWLAELGPADRVVLLDAVDMGLAPGSVRALDPGEGGVAFEGRLSLHGLGVGEALGVARRLWPAATIRVVGIQPQGVEPGSGLSQPVADALDELVNVALNQVAVWQKGLREHG